MKAGDVQPVSVVYVIVAVPAITPDTTPEPPFTVAVAVALLVHAPPVVTSPNDVVIPPAHTVAVPVIAAGAVGNGLTVITAAVP